MRARLAVLMVAATVFAPGTSLGDNSAQPSPSVVAARMLAPTFDEPVVAAYHAAASAKKVQEQDRRYSEALLGLVALVGAFSFANSRFKGSVSQCFRRRVRRLVSCNRDRGPPHLQLT